MRLMLAIVLFNIAALDAEALSWKNAKCTTSQKTRQIYTDAHNNLRQRQGLPKLVYDCTLENLAAAERAIPGTAKKHGYSKLEFFRESGRDHSELLRCSFQQLKGDANAFRK
ncbi:hypothetical protein OESDEN_12922, partial [Oesophagostomum dentatum]